MLNIKKGKTQAKKEREILINRKYTDFIVFISNNPDLNIVELYTVEGLQKEPDCFLILLWIFIKFYVKLSLLIIVMIFLMLIILNAFTQLLNMSLIYFMYALCT